MYHDKDWTKHSYAALCGTSSQPMLGMLEQYPNIVIFTAVALLVIGGISFAAKQGSLNSIKSRPVGDGQHSTAR